MSKGAPGDPLHWLRATVDQTVVVGFRRGSPGGRSGEALYRAATAWERDLPTGPPALHK